MLFIDIFKKEIIPAFGCTEPIALAFTTSKAVEILGCFPDSINIKCSGNIIKNAKSVFIPNSGGKKGIKYSAILGALAQNSKDKLQILESIKIKDIQKAEELYEMNFCQVTLVPNVENLYIEVEAFKNNEKAVVIVKDSHTNIVKIIKNEVIIYEKDQQTIKDEQYDMSFDSIYSFASEGHIDEILPIIKKQITYNMSIAEEGLKNSWGANIGQLILKSAEGDIIKKIQAYTAAASDARMGGCALPVMINSGSGNQGLTTTIPVILSARYIKASDEKLYRALVFSNLMGLYLKQKIGKLSAYCGVVSAASASICAIAFLNEEPKNIIAQTLSNSLACASGIICDGAKASCASKIAVALYSAFLAYEQAKANSSFKTGDGIVQKNIDETVDTIGIIASCGMKETDNIILQEMLKN